MKANLKKFRSLEYYINEKKSDDSLLILWNYNQSAQFEREWNEYTKMCRGLLTDNEGNIIARPFEKFFNLNETEETKIENLPLEKPVILEKLDGSLGIQYYADDKIKICTRGSFNSEQSKFATKWINKKYKKSDFMEGYTYLYEILYPENRIVVDYGTRKELVLLAVINIETKKELDLILEGKRLKIKTPKIINNNLPNVIKSLETLKSDEEGFVLKYRNGFRIKMKGQEYLRLHRLITGFSTKSIWECLMNGDNINDLITNVPDEFHAWVKEKEANLKTNYLKIEKKAKEGYDKIEDFNDRKSQAIYIFNNGYEDVSGVIFNMLDKREYTNIIWKALRPKWELPFKKEVK
jgi:RNA ligase